MDCRCFLLYVQLNGFADYLRNEMAEYDETLLNLASADYVE